MAMPVHDYLSASKFHRLGRCAGSLALAHGAPDYEDEPQEVRDWGTAGHELADLCIRTGKPAAKYHGRAFYAGHVADFEMVEAVQVYLDYVARVAPGGKSETRVPTYLLTGEQGAQGSIADYWYFDANTSTLYVIDLKLGFRPVRAKANDQLYGLAWAVLQMLRSQRPDVTVERIVVAIVQPRLASRPVDEYDVTVDELNEWADWLRDAIADAREAERLYLLGEPIDAYVTPGAVQCHYCPMRGAGCEAMSKFVLGTTGTSLVEVNQDVDAAAERIRNAIRELPTQDDETLGRLAEVVELVKTWARAVGEERDRRLNRGALVPGWKLVQGRGGNREWDDEAAVEALLAEHRVKRADRFESVLRSPTKLEKLLRNKRPELWAQLQQHITRAAPGLSAVPVSDSRPGVNKHDHAAKFAALESTTIDPCE